MVTSNYTSDIGFNRSILLECKYGKNYIELVTISNAENNNCRVRNKSVRFSWQTWQNLMDNLDEIEEKFLILSQGGDVDFRLKIGKNLYLSMTTDILCVDIRKFYLDNNSTLKPGQPGIGLKISEFREILAIKDDVNERFTLQPVSDSKNINQAVAKTPTLQQPPPATPQKPRLARQ